MWNRLSAFQIVLILVLRTICIVTTYGTGAPIVDSVCLHRLPRHGVTSQTTRSPYDVRMIVTKAAENYAITINITSPHGHAIRGFAVQLIPEVSDLDILDNRKPVGTFESNEDVKVLNCFSNGDTATHSNKNVKEFVVVRGKVNAGSIRQSVHIRATVLETFDHFWTDVTSDDVIKPVGGSEDASTEWLKLVTNMAHSFKGGHAQWEDSIKTRLKLGYYKMVDEWGHIRTKYIDEQLPFKDQFKKPETEDILKKDPKNTDISLKEAVEQFLLGDLRFSETVESLMNH